MKTVIFDFDGTLADSGECAFLAIQFAFKESRLSIPTKDEINYYMGIPIEQSFQEMSGYQLDDETFSRLLAQFRLSYQRFEVETLTAFFEIDVVLRELNSREIKLFVVSSKKQTFSIVIYKR